MSTCRTVFVLPWRSCVIFQNLLIHRWWSRCPGGWRWSLFSRLGKKEPAKVKKSQKSCAQLPKNFSFPHSNGRTMGGVFCTLATSCLYLLILRDGFIRSSKSAKSLPYLVGNFSQVCRKRLTELCPRPDTMANRELKFLNSLQWPAKTGKRLHVNDHAAPTNAGKPRSTYARCRVPAFTALKGRKVLPPRNAEKVSPPQFFVLQFIRGNTFCNLPWNLSLIWAESASLRGVVFLTTTSA